MDFFILLKINQVHSDFLFEKKHLVFLYKIAMNE